MKYSGHRKLLCELSKLSKFDASILVYKFCPKRTGFKMYAEYTLYTTAINFPCITPLRTALPQKVLDVLTVIFEFNVQVSPAK